MTPRSRRRDLHSGGPARMGGFSLLELIVAFVVFALAFGFLMQIVSGSLRNARQSAHYTQAALLAQSRLAEMGAGELLKPGSESGRFDNRYRWRLDVTPVEAPVAANGNIDAMALELMRLELVVEWREGVRERDAHFVTMRIQQKSG